MSTEDHIIAISEDVGYLKGRIEGILANTGDIKEGQDKLIEAFAAHLKASGEAHSDIIRRQDKVEMKVAAFVSVGVMILSEGFRWFVNRFHI